MSAYPTFLADFDERELVRDSSTLVAIDARGAITWFNPAYEQFAKQNGAPDLVQRFGVGASYYEAISGPLRATFEEAFARALETGQPYRLDYECSSEGLFRTFRLRALPFGREGLLLEHSSLVHAPHTRPPVEAIAPAYLHDHGFFKQCSNCRRMRRREGNAWDWVPSWVTAPPHPTSHGLCEACAGFYYGAMR